MEAVRSISWDAPEHTHPHKGGDWYFALGIVTLAVIIAALLLDNLLFALLATLSGFSIAIVASQPARVIPYEISVRGVKVGNTQIPYATLRSYYINEDDPKGPQLLMLSQKALATMLVVPIPEDYIDEIEEILAERLPEEYIEEPFFNKLLELLGF